MSVRPTQSNVSRRYSTCQEILETALFCSPAVWADRSRYRALIGGLFMRRKSIDSCLRQHVIPVVWDPGSHRDLIARASAVFLQGGALADLGEALQRFRDPHLENLPLFVHVDLVSGLENNEAGIEFLARFENITGVVTVHHHLA